MSISAYFDKFILDPRQVLNPLKTIKNNTLGVIFAAFTLFDGKSLHKRSSFYFFILNKHHTHF